MPTLRRKRDVRRLAIADETLANSVSDTAIKVLFFSRGRGRGHAIPDMEIATELKKLSPHVNLKFVSYGTGFATLKDGGWPAINLDLPDANPYLRTLIKSAQLLQTTKPDIIVAHEEFAALLAAHLSKIPSVFLSAWMPFGENVGTDSLEFANSIIILEDPGIFPVHNVIVPPIYMGPMRRRMKYTINHKPLARKELGINNDASVVSIIAGSFMSEESAPITEAVFSALAILGPSMQLIWVAGDDFRSISTKAKRFRNIRVIRFQKAIDQIIVASDVVITKATRGATLDAAMLGVPTISLSPRTNVIDDLLVPRIPSNTALTAAAVDGNTLALHILRILERRKDRNTLDMPAACSPCDVAIQLMREFTRLLVK